MYKSFVTAITQNGFADATNNTEYGPIPNRDRRVLQALLLKINGSEAYIAQRSSTFGTVPDKFITDERLKEIKAHRPGETVDDGLKFSPQNYGLISFSVLQCYFLFA